MLVKELRGTESTQDACAKMRVKHELRHVFLLLFAHLVGFCSENSNTASQHKCGLGIKGIYFYTLSWVAQSAPPPRLPNSVFFFAALICLLLSRLLVFYSNANSHSLSWSLCSYLTLSSSAAAVWRDILIFMRILVLLYLCWHIRGLLILFLNTFMHLLL